MTKINDEAIRAARWTREFQSLWTGRLPAGVEAEEVVRVMLEAALPELRGMCHNGHPFEPGIDVDMVAEGRSPDPRWCNVCGEGARL